MREYLVHYDDQDYHVREDDDVWPLPVSGRRAALILSFINDPDAAEKAGAEVIAYKGGA